MYAGAKGIYEKSTRKVKSKKLDQNIDVLKKAADRAMG